MSTTAVAPTGLIWLKGESLDLTEEFKKGDKVFVLEFWATWCPPCRRSIPHLSELQKKWAKDVIFIGITDEDPRTAKPFVDQMGNQMNYHVASDASRSAYANFMNKFSIQGIPHAFIVDRNSQIAWHGHPSEHAFEDTLKRCSAESPKPKIDLKTLTDDKLHEMPVKQLKEILKSKGVDSSEAVEKIDLINLIKSKVLSNL